MLNGVSRSFVLRLTVSVLTFVLLGSFLFGVMRLRSATPALDRTALQVVTVQSAADLPRARPGHSGPRRSSMAGSGNRWPHRSDFFASRRTRKARLRHYAVK